LVYHQLLMTFCHKLQDEIIFTKDIK